VKEEVGQFSGLVGNLFEYRHK